MPCFAARVLVVLSLVGSTALGQTPSAQPPSLYHLTNTTRNALGDDLASPAPELPLFPPAGTPATEPVPQWNAKFDYTYLPGDGASGFGIQDVEASAKFTVPLGPRWGPVWVNPGAGMHFWQGPNSPCADLPGAVYDLYVDFGWRPRPYEWLFLDLRFTPGIYTDFHNDSVSMFRPRGHALGIVALSEKFQFVAGAIYTNRLRTTLIPAGGIMWAPSDDWQIDLVFPAPKIARRVALSGDTKWWLYLSGEFGGGAWAVERAHGFADTVDYTDLRLIAGIEAVTAAGRKAHLEAGYVFGRRISYGSERPGSYDPDPTILLRAGFSY